MWWIKLSCSDRNEMDSASLLHLCIAHASALIVSHCIHSLQLVSFVYWKHDFPALFARFDFHIKKIFAIISNDWNLHISMSQCDLIRFEIRYCGLRSKANHCRAEEQAMREREGKNYLLLFRPHTEWNFNSKLFDSILFSSVHNFLFLHFVHVPHTSLKLCVHFTLTLYSSWEPQNWLLFVVRSAIAAVLLVRVCIHDMNMCELNRIDDDDDGITPSLHNHIEFSRNTAFSSINVRLFHRFCLKKWLFLCALTVRFNTIQTKNSRNLFRQHFTLYELHFIRYSNAFEHPTGSHYFFLTTPFNENLNRCIFLVQTFPFDWWRKKILQFHQFIPILRQNNETKWVVATVWMATPKSVQILRLHKLNTVFCSLKKIFSLLDTFTALPQIHP